MNSMVDKPIKAFWGSYILKIIFNLRNKNPDIMSGFLFFVKLIVRNLN
jgi:hypothetical protein